MSLLNLLVSIVDSSKFIIAPIYPLTIFTNGPCFEMLARVIWTGVGWDDKHDNCANPVQENDDGDLTVIMILIGE